MKLPIDLLVFDLDGTLADSIPPAIIAIQRMLRDLKLPAKSEAEINHFVGYGEVPLISGAISSTDPELLKTSMELYFKYYREKEVLAIKPFRHVPELLMAFKSKTKVILSNKRDEFIRLIIDNNGLTAYFAEILGGDTAPCLKPDPCVLLALLEKYKVKPARVLFIGDMVIDVETGKNAGTHTCAVTYGFDGRAKLEKVKPDFLIDDIIQLKELIV